MNSINENGCSVCQPGKENYTTYTTKLGRKRMRMYQYDYRTGVLSRGVAVVAFHFDLVKVGCSIQPPATIEY